jgi:site-specific DNA recombinase
MLFDPDGRPMSPSHTSKGSKRYRHYETRTKAGESKDQLWRLAAGEIDRLVIAAIVDRLQKPCSNDTSRTAVEVAIEIADQQDVADQIATLSTADQRREFLVLKLRVYLRETSIAIAFGTSKTRRTEIALAAKLAKRGNDLRLILNDNRTASPDPFLRKLIAQAFAARDYLTTGILHPCIREYSSRYLSRIARISWLAPDMISAMLEGTQPLQLTGRRLIRANAIPLDWPSQRAMFGFS